MNLLLKWFSSWRRRDKKGGTQRIPLNGCMCVMVVGGGWRGLYNALGGAKLSRIQWKRSVKSGTTTLSVLRANEEFTWINSQAHLVPKTKLPPTLMGLKGRKLNVPTCTSLLRLSKWWWVPRQGKGPKHFAVPALRNHTKLHYPGFALIR